MRLFLSLFLSLLVVNCGNGLIVPLEVSDSDYCTSSGTSSQFSNVAESDALIDPTNLATRAKLLQDQNRLQEAIWLYRRDSSTSSQQKADELESQILNSLKNDSYTILKTNIGGSTENYLLSLQSGITALYKPPGKWDMDPDAEVGTYLVSSLLGLSMTPIAAKRTIEGKEGSIQYFASGMSTGSYSYSKAVNYRKMVILDYLIFNHDRAEGNFLYWKDENFVVAIDHGRAFKTRCGITQEIKNHLAVEKQVANRIQTISKSEVYSTLSGLRGEIADRVWDQINHLR